MPEENKKAPRGFSFLKLALFLLIVVLIVGVALYSFMGINPAEMVSSGLTGLYHRVFAVGKAEFAQKVMQIASFDPDEPLSCAPVSGNIAVASISSLKVYDGDGNEKWYVPLSVKKPYIQSFNNKVLVADLGGRYFSLISDGRVLWEKTLDEDIVNASLSEDWVLVITKSKESGYKRTITAYSPDGDTVSIRNVSDYFPFAAFHYRDFDPASFIVCGVEASGLETNALFEFLNPSMNQRGSIRGQKEIYAGALPLENQSLLLYGEKSLICVNQALKTLWQQTLKDQAVTGASAIGRKFPVVAELDEALLSREKRLETTVKVLNTNGTDKAKLVLDAKVTGITASGRTAAVVAGPEVYFINEKGEIMDR
ncbi:MAG: DUF5711 family protein, partial [Clostridia bacterium]|nr:DUF5711 family protein [Clostridia bacterium]